MGWISRAAALTVSVTAPIQVALATGQPTPWGLGLQEGASPIKHEIAWFHNGLLLPIITVITLFVLALLLYVMMRFSAAKNPTPSRTAHNTVVEIAWTAIPIVILVVIAIPSFRLLYKQDRAVNRLITGDPVEFTGYIRFPEAAGTLTPPENAVKRLWFTRDHLAMARALGWGEDRKAIAPFYVDLEAPVPDSGIPRPGPLSVRLKDDHLQYAVTWFTLAFAVVIAFGVWWRGQRRS